MKVVEFVNDKKSLFKGYEVSQVACGDHHTMCLTYKGAVYVWGGHFKGKRGDDPEKRPQRPKEKSVSFLYHIPCQIDALKNQKII